MLSSRTRSAPASMTSRACSTVSTSTSSRQVGIRARGPARTRATTPPAAATWLSLTSAASDSDMRWLTPAAAAHRVLLQRPQPRHASCGCRGSARRCPRPRRPSAGSAWRRRDRWPSRFSAVRSAVSRSRTGPRTVASTSPGSTRAPSAVPNSTRSRPWLTVVEHVGRDRQARRPRRAARGTRSAAPTASAGDGRQRGDVACGAEVLVQRARDDVVDDVPRQSGRSSSVMRAVRVRTSVVTGPSAPSVVSRCPRQCASSRVGEVVAPVRAAGLLAQPRRLRRGGGDGEQVRRLPVLGGGRRGGRLGELGRARGRLARGPCDRAARRRARDMICCSARTSRVVEQRVRDGRSGDRRRRRGARLVQPLDDRRRRCAGRTPAPRAASWTRAGSRRARRCRPTRRTRTARAATTRRAGRCARRRWRSGWPARPGSGRAPGRCRARAASS